MKRLFPITIIAISIWACSGSSTENKKETESEPEVTTTAPAETEKPRVFFKAPEDGATVSSPVFVDMGVVGMQIEPAGEVNEGFGHHHILVNQEFWPDGEVIPASDTTIHFGKGQTNTSLELEPGEYTLSLQFANGVHASYGPDMAASIKVTVK